MGSSGINADQLQTNINRVKEYRKSLPNGKELQALRQQCREEVTKLAEQSYQTKKGSLIRRMSYGVTSFRKKVFHSLKNINSKSSKFAGKAIRGISSQKPKKEKETSPDISKEVE